MVLLAIGLLVVDMGITAKKRANQDKEFQEQLLQSMQEDRWQREELAEQAAQERKDAKALEALESGDWETFNAMNEEF